MMEVSANLKNIVVLDCNKEAFYKKVQCLLESSHVYITIGCLWVSGIADLGIFGSEYFLLCFNNHFYYFSFLSQAVSIADKEVFAFRMLNYTDATEGDGYLNMSNVDTSVTLTVGCIQVIFLNKFLDSILVRTNYPV